MQTGHPKPQPKKAAEAAQIASGEHKQRWKERPGNRYTAEELRIMSKSLGRIHILEQEFHIMRLE